MYQKVAEYQDYFNGDLVKKASRFNIEVVPGVRNKFERSHSFLVRSGVSLSCRDYTLGLVRGVIINYLKDPEKLNEITLVLEELLVNTYASIMRLLLTRLENKEAQNIEDSFYLAVTCSAKCLIFDIYENGDHFDYGAYKQKKHQPLEEEKLSIGKKVFLDRSGKIVFKEPGGFGLKIINAYTSEFWVKSFFTKQIFLFEGRKIRAKKHIYARIDLD